MGPYSCNGVCLNNTCIRFEHICNPTWWDDRNLSPSPSTFWGWSPPFFYDFHLETEVTLNQKTFVYALVHSPCLSSGGLLGMVFELLRDCFVPNDSTSGFDLFFKVCGHIARSHVPPSISNFLFSFGFLVLEKQSWGICTITIGEVTYCLIACTMAN